MTRVKDFIRKIIEEYLDRELEFNPEEIGTTEDLIEAIDVNTLSKEIVKKLEERILEFSPTPDVDDLNIGYMCKTCYRPFGEWRGKNGLPVQMSIVNSRGKKIIIVDDF